MKLVQLFHNPGAGDEEHDKENLVSLIESNGFECRYSSTKKKDWKGFEEDADFVAIAGGDGTVRKITKEILDRKMTDKVWPIALMPLGTANNIAKTLGLDKTPEELISSWQNKNLKKFDVGRIEGIEETGFFLESLGYGIFPYLMKEMKKRGKEEMETPEAKMTAALKLLHQVILSYEPRYCQLTIDGVDHSGKFLLVEIMNTKSIGPNLFLSPNADPGDGEFEVIIIPESDKEKFATYALDKINGKEEADYDFTGLSAKNIKISWDGTHVHVDDEVIKLEKNAELKIELKEGLLQFIVP